MLLLIIFVLRAVALSRTVEDSRQHLLMLGNPSALDDLPGGSIVKLCPESRDTDILVVERIVNRPGLPVLYVLRAIFDRLFEFDF